MIKINENFTRLRGSYLFSEIGRRVDEHAAKHPGAPVIKMGIGDVTRPLVPAVVAAIKNAVDEMGGAATFRGYGPDQGYGFLRQAVAQGDYRSRGIDMDEDEIFISDGAKCDTSNFQELLSKDVRVAVTDPVYTVYVDTNVMAGRSGEFDEKTGRYSNIEYLSATAKNGFVPPLPQTRPDLIYLCYPNNPTGTVLKRGELKRFVDYALSEGALILFDGAYEAFVTEDVPRSIYEIEGARRCAIEFRSFSKTAGFTGARCAYTVVPRDIMGTDGVKQYSLNEMWLRRHSTKFNGVPYYTQRGAQAVYSKEGREQVQENIAYYLKNTSALLRGLKDAGIEAYGGVNSPYVWLKCPGGLDSWAFFDLLLGKANVVGTPGAGFGSAGEGYFRLTGFNTYENTLEAVRRLRAL